MGTQVLLFNPDDFQPQGLKRVKKRIRYKTPTYTKSYTFCHKNPFTDELQYDGDEKHIFRIRNLHYIYSKIYNYLGVNPLQHLEKIEQKGLTIWLDDMQAEITGTEMLSIKQRIKLHIKLLRLLRQEVEVEDAVDKVKGEC